MLTARCVELDILPLKSRVFKVGISRETFGDFKSDVRNTTAALDICPKYLFSMCIGVLVLSHVIWRTISGYLRLRAYPGPFIASLTDFWLLHSFWNKQPWRDTSTQLHKQYGPVVRYGPNRLMFSDPSSIPVILATSNVFEKVSRSTCRCGHL